jgi:hypothetical protein
VGRWVTSEVRIGGPGEQILSVLGANIAYSFHYRGPSLWVLSGRRRGRNGCLARVWKWLAGRKSREGRQEKAGGPGLSQKGADF